MRGKLQFLAVPEEVRITKSVVFYPSVPKYKII
jgi:hypothetical protein